MEHLSCLLLSHGWLFLTELTNACFHLSSRHKTSLLVTLSRDSKVFHATLCFFPVIILECITMINIHPIYNVPPPLPKKKKKELSIFFYWHPNLKELFQCATFLKIFRSWLSCGTVLSYLRTASKWKLNMHFRFS